MGSITSWSSSDFTEFYRLLETDFLPMIQAIEQNQIDELRCLVTEEKHPPYNKLIEIAISKNKTEALQLLLDMSSQSDIPIKIDHQRIIDLARNKDDLEILAPLLRHIDKTNIVHLLQEAIVLRDLTLLENFLAAGADVNAGDGLPLLQAVTSNQISALELLIQAGANVNTSQGEEALSLAMLQQNKTMIQLFQDAGADIHKKRFISTKYRELNKGLMQAPIFAETLLTRDALIKAVHQNDIKQIELWKKEKKLQSDLDFGLVLIEAVKEKKFRIFKNLLKENILLVWQEHRRIAIQIAAENNSRLFLFPLLDDPKDSAELYGTALIAASKAGHHQLVLDLLNKASDRSLAFALKNAAEKRHLEIFQDLLTRISERLENGASVSSITTEDPLEIHTLFQETLGIVLKESAECGDSEVVNLLLQKGIHISKLDKRIAIIRARPNGFSEIIEAIENNNTL